MLVNLDTSLLSIRWLVDPSEAPQLFTFSYGPHSCVGMNLAILEAKLVSGWHQQRTDCPLPAVVHATLGKQGRCMTFS